MLGEVRQGAFQRQSRGISMVMRAHVTVEAMASDIKHGLAAGFRHYLTKPIRIGEVLAAIDAVTQGEAGSP